SQGHHRPHHGHERSRTLASRPCSEPCRQAAPNPTLDIACNTLPCTFTRMGLPPHLPAGGIGRVLRPRDRAHVYAFASALWGSHERPWRIGGAVERSHASNPIAVTDRLAHASLRQ